MSLLNPFKKNEPSQTQVIADERNYASEQGAIRDMNPPSGVDEEIYLQQQQQKADLTKWQQNLEPELQQLYHNIRGEVNYGNEDEPNWKSPSGVDPLANDIFIQRACGLARPLLSKNLIMSNYNEARIMTNLKRVVFCLRYDILCNRHMYDMEKGDINIIIGMFKEIIEAAYFRSLNDGERRHLGTIGKRMEVHMDRPDVPKKGLFNMGG